MGLIVYNAAPYSDSASVTTLHQTLTDAGITSVDVWSTMGLDAIDLTSAEPSVIRQVAAGAEALVLASHVLVLQNTAPSVDSIALAAFAFSCGLPVLWVGPPNIAAFRPGVVMVVDVNAAVQWLVNVAAPLAASGGLYEVRQSLRSRMG